MADERCDCDEALRAAIAANRAGVNMEKVGFVCLECLQVFTAKKEGDNDG